MTKDVGLPKTFPLETLIQIINNCLEKANTKLEKSSLCIEEASIALKTIYDVSGGGGFKVFVKASKKFEFEHANVFTYNFTKIDKLKSIQAFGLKEFEFEKNLTSAIVQAALEWEKISENVRGLQKDGFMVQISFAFKNISEGGVEFEISGIGINADASTGKKVVHQITLKFN